MPNDVARNAETGTDSTRGRTTLAILALLLLAILAYANSIAHPFVYDDLLLVLKNPQIRSLSNVPALMGFQADGFHVVTRWTRTVTYALEYAIAGPWPPLYHATNVLLHALVGLLVFLLMTRVSRDRVVGFWAAALFVVHPINTEVVAHISGRRELLATLFSLAALLLLQGYTRFGGFWRLGLAVLSIYLGVFSKELAVMAPLAFVAVDLYTRYHSPERQRETTQGRRAPWLHELGGHLFERRFLYAGLALITLVLAGSVLFLTDDVGIQGSRGFYDTTGNQLTLFQRMAVSGLGLRLLLLPWNQTVDYSFDALGLTGSPEIGWIEVALLLVALGLGTWGLCRRNWAGFAGIWCVVFYLPHTGIIPWHEVFAERFLYLSAIGFCAAVAAAGVALARSGPWRKPVLGLGVGILLLLTAGTLRQNEVWGSSLALWSHAVEQYPGCARAQKALADAYLAESRPDLALEHFETAARILPNYADAQVGVAVARTARREYSEALALLDRILERWPTHATALNAKAYVHQTLGEPDKAMETYQRAVELNPRFADGYNNMARLYVERGDLETAIEMYEKALEQDPALIPALLNLAVVYREGFKDEERAGYYEEKAKELQALR